MTFTPLGDAIQDSLNAKDALGKQVQAASVLDAATTVFEQRFGKEEAAQVVPRFVKNKTLTVTCSSSVIAQEIRLNQAEIVDQINDVCGAKEIDRIRYLA